VRPDREHFVAVLLYALERRHLLAEMDVRAKLEALLDTEVDERLALNLWVPGDIEDVLLRVNGRDLAPQLLEALDDADRGIAVAGVVRRSEPDGAAADDRDIADAFGHPTRMLPSAPRGET
jgi:hypothetical protein